MDPIEKGKTYWSLATWFHRGSRSRLQTASCVFQMAKLEKELESQPVLRRVKSFISKHRAEVPGNGQFDGGGGHA